MGLLLRPPQGSEVRSGGELHLFVVGWNPLRKVSAIDSDNTVLGHKGCNAVVVAEHLGLNLFARARSANIMLEGFLADLLQMALVRGSANVRNFVFDGPAYLVAPVEAWQRTDFGRPQASIRLRMATPIAASVC